MVEHISEEAAAIDQVFGNKEAIVSVCTLEKSYRMGGDSVRVLRGVDLEIHAGEIVAVTGASGAGKSTLLHVLGTLERPTSGEIRYKNRSLSGLSDAELALFRNREIGFIFQFHHLLPEFSALENVMIPGMLGGESRREVEGRAGHLLDRVGLKERIHHRPSELSGGEQQRVAIARALVNRPSLVLADEPTGNLDSGAASLIFELMKEINHSDGVTFLVATHNAEIAGRMDRQAVMVDGRIDAK